MAKGGRAIVEKSRRRISKWNGDEDEEDDEYVAEEEEELESESYEESLASLSDSEDDGGEFGGNLEEFSESDGSVEEDSDFELDESEFEEDDEISVKRSTKRRKKSGKAQKKARRKVLVSDEDDEDFDTKPVSNQNRRKQSRKNESDESDYEEKEDDDCDDLDEDEDEDFTPDVDYEDEESVSNSKRKNGYRKKRASRSPVKRRKSKKPKISRRKKPTGTRNKKEKKSRKKRRRGRRSSSKEPATKRKRRSAQVNDDFIVDDDDDFIMEDRDETKQKSNKRKYVSDSDTSEFEFITSDEDDFVTEEQIEPKKRKKHKVFCSGSGSESDSSDSDFVVYEEEEEVVKEGRKRKREDVKGKGKEGEKEEDLGKKVCGICLSEEQRRTTRGVLECCAHFFCFACIIEWSKVESRCPVCKRRFEFITKASSSDADDLDFGVPRKVIKVPKRDQVYQPSEEDIRGMLDPYENVVCMECQQGGDDYLMLLCDICDSSAHTYCVGLGHAVPEGNWYCDCCRSSSGGPSNPQAQPSVAPSDPAPTESDHSVNLQQRASSSSLEIDLNAPPRDNFEEAGTQVLGGPSQVASPSTGGAATLSNRRHIQNRIRILLSNTRPMQVVRRNREENAGSNGVRFGLRVGRSSGQQGSILAPHGERGASHEADKAKEQVRSMVKNHLKQLSSNTSLDRDAFKDVARRATYTVLSVCGFGVEHRNLVSRSISAPTGCCHEIRGSEQASLLAGSCSACFDSFIGHVVASILNLG